MKPSQERLKGARVDGMDTKYEFRHDLPYMKADIWGEGKPEDTDESANAEIYRVFGHDPHTYPNIDNAQHFATVQFAGSVDTNSTVLADKDAKRTDINDALRAVADNAEGKFARDGAYMREDLWDKVPVEKSDVQRTDRGLRKDLDNITSREGSWGSDHQFEREAGYMQSDILTKETKEPAQPEDPKEPETPDPVDPPVEPQPEDPKEPECPSEDSNCEPGTLGNALAAADRAEKQVEKIIDPIGTPEASETTEESTAAETPVPEDTNAAEEAKETE